MTILVGTDVTTSFTATDDGYDVNRAWYWAAGNVATESGNATTLGLYLYSWNTSSAVKLLLFNSTGTLLASTAGLTGTAPGWITGSITSTEITQGETYLLSFLANGMIYPYNDGGTYDANYNSMTYATPGNIDLGESINNNKGQFAIYADGTTGGGSVDLTPGAGELTAAGLAPIRLVDYARAPGLAELAAEGFAPTFIERGLRYAYPTTDTSAGAWTPSAGGDLFAMIDEETPADDDYIVTTTASKCKIKLLPVTDPAASTGHVINYRIWSPVAGNAVVRLIQGASTLIAEWTHSGLPTTATTYSQGLTTEQTDAITDYDDLYIEFEAT
jgi:hypothetical protein